MISQREIIVQIIGIASAIGLYCGLALFILYYHAYLVEKLNQIQQNKEIYENQTFVKYIGNGTYAIIT